MPTPVAQIVLGLGGLSILTWVEVAAVVILVIWLVRGNLYERLQALEWKFWRATGLRVSDSGRDLSSPPALGTRPPTDGLRCGACGYSVRGATSLTCSECGADYRLVGMKSNASERTWGTIPIALLWGIAILFIAGPINDVIESATYVQTQTITSRAEYLAASKAFALGIAADLTETQYGRNGFQPSGRYSDESLVTITLAGSLGQGATLPLHPGRGEYEMVGPDGEHTAADGWPTKETVDRCLTLIGVDLSDPVHAGEAGTVFNVIMRYQPGVIVDVTDVPSPHASGRSVSGIDRTPYQFFPGGPYSQSSSTTFGTPPWVTIGLRLFWLALWIIGIVTVQRRSQRR